ncbi:MAG: hypothetical protein ACRDYZ_02480, partial [Acidimicrobiales bacterium]
PKKLENAAFAYDPTLDVPVLFGGDDANGTVGAYWTWNGTRWFRAASGYNTGLTSVALAQDPANGRDHRTLPRLDHRNSPVVS